MNLTTNDATNIDDILSRVDLPPMQHGADLTAKDKDLIQRTAKRAYGLAMAADKSVAEARDAALEAVRKLGVAGSAESAPATALLESSGTKWNGSATSTPRFDVAAGNKILEEAEASKTTHDTHEQSEAQGVDVHGLARSERDLAAARAAGFAPAETVWTRGLRVITAGVGAAKRSRLEYDAKPLVRDACSDLQQRVAHEARHDLTSSTVSVAMLPDGQVFLEAAGPRGVPLPISRDAFSSMVNRLGYGGARYLSDKCDSPLRAHNVNAQREYLAGDKRELVFRTRGPKEARSVFGVVSPGYAAFDVDKVAEAIAETTPPEARGTVTYDGTRTRVEVLFQTTVQPKHFVAGEFFRAGVIVRSDDTGGGAIRGSSVVWQNLCLNLAIIDRQARDLFSLRHTGSVAILAAKFRGEFKKSLGSIDHFIKAWDYACEEDVIAVARAVSSDRAPVSHVDVLGGIFAGLIGKGGAIRMPGRRSVEAYVDSLVECWQADASGAGSVHNASRASIVNAFTRYAHTVLESIDPFAEDELQRQASALLWGSRGKAPKPLEYVDLSRAADETAAAS